MRLQSFFVCGCVFVKVCIVLTVCPRGVLWTCIVVAYSGPPPGVCKKSADAGSGQDIVHTAPTLPLAAWKDPEQTHNHTNTNRHRKAQESDNDNSILPFQTLPLSFFNRSPTGSGGLLLKPEANPPLLSSCDTESKREVFSGDLITIKLHRSISSLSLIHPLCDWIAVV